jgi:hypothetical protein
VPRLSVVRPNRRPASTSCWSGCGDREAYDAVQAGEALLVDIRYAALRERDGLIPVGSYTVTA